MSTVNAFDVSTQELRCTPRAEQYRNPTIQDGGLKIQKLAPRWQATSGARRSEVRGCLCRRGSGLRSYTGEYAPPLRDSVSRQWARSTIHPAIELHTDSKKLLKCLQSCFFFTACSRRRHSVQKGSFVRLRNCLYKVDGHQIRFESNKTFFLA